MGSSPAAHISALLNAPSQRSLYSLPSLNVENRKNDLQTIFDAHPTPTLTNPSPKGAVLSTLTRISLGSKVSSDLLGMTNFHCSSAQDRPVIDIDPYRNLGRIEEMFRFS